MREAPRIDAASARRGRIGGGARRGAARHAQARGLLSAWQARARSRRRTAQCGRARLDLDVEEQLRVGRRARQAASRRHFRRSGFHASAPLRRPLPCS
jgi:hypothetical protein